MHYSLFIYMGFAWPYWPKFWQKQWCLMYYYMKKTQFYHRLQDSSGPWTQRALFKKKLQSINIIHNQGYQSHKTAMTTFVITNWIRHYQHSRKDQPNRGSLLTTLVCILYHRHMSSQSLVLKNVVSVCSMICQKRKDDALDIVLIFLTVVICVV